VTVTGLWRPLEMNDSFRMRWCADRVERQLYRKALADVKSLFFHTSVYIQSSDLFLVEKEKHLE